MNKITVSQLQPGDVLLYHRTAFMSRLIQLFDGTSFSHASIFDGENVVEAIGSGVVVRSVHDSTFDAEYVKVFRLFKSGNVLGSPELPYDPVGQKGIDWFKNNPQRYAYEEILLLAVLAITRRVPLPFVRPILDHAAGVIVAIIAQGKQPVICSELVYRCFLNAGDQYLPTIVGYQELGAVIARNARLGGPDAQRLDDEEFERRRITAQYLELYLRSKMEAENFNAFGAVGPDPNFITPGDLSKSPDLHCQGVLQT